MKIAYSAQLSAYYGLNAFWKSPQIPGTFITTTQKYGAFGIFNLCIPVIRKVV